MRRRESYQEFLLPWHRRRLPDTSTEAATSPIGARSWKRTDRKGTKQASVVFVLPLNTLPEEPAGNVRIGTANRIPATFAAPSILLSWVSAGFDKKVSSQRHYSHPPGSGIPRSVSDTHNGIDSCCLFHVGYPRRRFCGIMMMLLLQRRFEFPWTRFLPVYYFMFFPFQYESNSARTTSRKVPRIVESSTNTHLHA